MDFKKKYIKYKTKYIELKKQEGGMKLLEKFFKKRPVQENLLKPIVTTNFDGNKQKITLPKGSRLYHLSPENNLELTNKPTFFGASPIGSVIMAPTEGLNLLSNHRRKLYDTIYILTLKSDVDFLLDGSLETENIMRPYGYGLKGSSANKFLNKYGIRFQEFIINNPTEHEFKKSNLKPFDFGSVNLFLAKFPFEEFLGEPILGHNCELTKLQKYKIKKKWKDYKIDNYLKEEPISGYMKYELTKSGSDDFKYKIKHLKDFLKIKKEKYYKEKLIFKDVNIIDESESTDHNLPLWIPMYNYIIINENMLLIEINKLININEFNKKVLFNLEVANKFYKLVNNFKNKLLEKHINKFTQSNNYYLNINDNLKIYIKKEIEKDYNRLIKERIAKIDWKKCFSKIGIVEAIFSDEKELENFNINQNLNNLINMYSGEIEGNKYIKKFRLEDLKTKILKIDNNSNLFFKNINSDTITNFIKNIDDINTKDFIKYFEIENNILEIKLLIWKEKYIENFDLEKQEELLNELKKEKKDNYNVKKFEELKSLYFLKLIIKEYKNDILKDPDMVIVFNNLIDNLKNKLEN